MTAGCRSWSRFSSLQAWSGSKLGPLSFGAISGLLAGRLGGPLPRRVARQVFDASGGNPLFALELGRAVAERGVPEIGAALPVPAVLG